ncbi:MAG: molybdopterin molybdotransferase MoeA [Hyphomicrobiales bacterium]|nr:molybdopterin molybdotransferase MoeA [Hyphomicrobiales bacterium]
MSLLPVEAAIQRIVSGVVPLGIESIPVADAYGRVLGDDLAARRDQPPFPASAMDGYAVRGENATAGARLRVIGMAAAGDRFVGTVGPDDAVRIFTGAPVPAGADTILIQENAERLDDDTVVASRSASPGRHIRAAGMDFRAGDLLLRSGRCLDPQDVSLAAAMGYGDVPVRRRPVVSILATGDELVPPGIEPGPDQIVSSNGVGIAALVRSLGGEPRDLGIVVDDRDSLAATIAGPNAQSADVLVTLGGASVGDHDLVRQTLLDVGMKLDFWRIAIRPGKPLMFGRFEELRVLGLPGNPVSAMVCGLLFLAPLITELLGLPAHDPEENAVLGADMPANGDRQDYVRGRLSGRGGGPPAAIPLPLQDSAMLSALAAANCLIVRPPHAVGARSGEACRIIRLPHG